MSKEVEFLKSQGLIYSEKHGFIIYDMMNPGSPKIDIEQLLINYKNQKV